MIKATTFSRVTPYYQNHLESGAEMMLKGGWLRPAKYTSTETEVNNTRRDIGIIDAHSMGKFEISGRDAFSFMQYLITNDLNKIKQGRGGIYTCLCNENGGVIDDVVVYFIDRENFYFITNTLSVSRVDEWIRCVAKKNNFNVHIQNSTNSIAYLALQGPKSPLMINLLFGSNGVSLNYFEFTKINLENVPVLLARTGYTGEIGYELNFPSEFGYVIWKYLLEKGKPYGITPVGGLAVQVLRIEKAYLSHGTDMSVDNNPFEVGLGWTLSFTKGDFLGREELLLIQKNGVTKKLFGFEIESCAKECQKGNPIFCKGNYAGYITSCCKSPTLNKIIALGFIEKPYWEDNHFALKGDALSILKKVNTPFYDNKKIRVKADSKHI